MTYPGYIDVATGRTLVCEPGNTYDVIPSSASTETPTDGRFIPADAGEPETPESPGDKRRRVPQAATETAPDEMKEA